MGFFYPGEKEVQEGHSQGNLGLVQRSGTGGEGIASSGSRGGLRWRFGKKLLTERVVKHWNSCPGKWWHCSILGRVKPVGLAMRMWFMVMAPSWKLDLTTSKVFSSPSVRDSVVLPSLPLYPFSGGIYLHPRHINLLIRVCLPPCCMFNSFRTPERPHLWICPGRNVNANPN